MFTRKEMRAAYASSGLNDVTEFTDFLSGLSRLLPHMLYSVEANNSIKDLLYNDSFDTLTSSFITLYIELLANRGIEFDTRDVYLSIFNSPFMQDIKQVALPDTEDTPFEDTVMTLIVLLNIYKITKE